LEKTLDSVAVSQKEKNSGNQTVAEKNFLVKQKNEAPS